MRQCQGSVPMLVPTGTSCRQTCAPRLDSPRPKAMVNNLGSAFGPTVISNTQSSFAITVIHNNKFPLSRSLDFFEYHGIEKKGIGCISHIVVDLLVKCLSHIVADLLVKCLSRYLKV